MTGPSSPICFCLLLSAVLGALAYFKIDPERRIMCLSFVFVSVPVVLLVAYVAGGVAGLDGPWVTRAFLALGLLSLAGSIWHARVLLPKTEMR